MLNIADRLAAQYAKPFTHCVVTTYADGAVKRHETRCAKSAENYAIGERRKVGRELISRETGAPVLVKSVAVEAI